MEKYTTVEAYIASFPDHIQERLNRMRSLIREHAPEAVESIAYGMPAYKINKKPLVYFAGYAGHIGFYATPTGHAAFAEALSAYKQGKGSVQFPLDQPLPEALIADIVKFRVSESKAKG
ncbi:MAG: DUF1801 domain-containing protein [Saprospiraceae bacterium]|nr:DUF1801 domain-containing protein [Saprospiraceae bacterium]